MCFFSESGVNHLWTESSSGLTKHAGWKELDDQLLQVFFLTQHWHFNTHAHIRTPHTPPTQIERVRVGGDMEKENSLNNT